MTILDERERGEEARFGHDQDPALRVRERRGRLLGPRVARELLGLGEGVAAAYGGDVILAGFGAPGDPDLIAKVQADLAAVGREAAEDVPRERLTVFRAGARRQAVAG